MKKLILLAAAAFFCSSNIHAQTAPDITSWIQNTTLTGYGGIISNVQLVQYSSSYVYVSTNCVPEYAIGPWPTNPNVPSAQNYVCEFPRNPVQNTGAATNVGLGTIGLWSNGVSIFNPEDGFHWNSSTNAWAMGPGPNWNRNAYIFEGVSFDSCLGHPNQTGTYHNHVNPRCLYSDIDSTHHSPIIGYAFDGFPIYGAYGYVSTTSASGPVKRMRSSYVLTTDTVRAGGPSVSAWPLGDCCEDYIYTAGAGDLDAHNGRFCYTPDYPDGTYAYFVTLDDNLKPVYPFVLGKTYYGVVGSTNTHITPSGTDTTYTTAVPTVVNTTIKYQIVPNPVADHAYIYMDAANMNNVTGNLFNAEGRLLKTITFMQPSIAYALDMSDLPAGMYLLSFESAGTRVTEKIVKN
jgi:hypothetical protein